MFADRGSTDPTAPATDIQQAGVPCCPFHAVVAPGQRIGEIMRDALVKLAVLVVFTRLVSTTPAPLLIFSREITVSPSFSFPFFNLYRHGDGDRTFTTIERTRQSSREFYPPSRRCGDFRTTVTLVISVTKPAFACRIPRTRHFPACRLPHGYVRSLYRPHKRGVEAYANRPMSWLSSPDVDPH